MATEISNIDELLAQQAPLTQAQKEIDPDVEIEENEAQEFGSEVEPQNIETEPEEEPEKKNEEKDPEPSVDEYGNEKPTPRTYTEDEVNEMFRKRFARGSHQGSQPTIQQQQQVTEQAQNFEYDPSAEGNWQQQLEQFVEHTFNKMNQRNIAQQQAAHEQQAEAEFIGKFNQGMERFTDFREVVGQQPVTDHMALALRGVNDPAAFIYAASRRHPAELQRISQIKDPYSQIVEMGKLEERMKKQPQGTQAPRPIARDTENAPMVEKKKSAELTIEDLIARSERKKMALMKQKRGK